MLILPTEAVRGEIRSADAARFLAWICSAKPGWRAEYHVGNLAAERLDDPTLHTVGRLFLAASDIGLVTLTQRRVEPEACSYEAVRTRHTLLVIERKILDNVIRPRGKRE
jgi:hypothetical protein